MTKSARSLVTGPPSLRPTGTSGRVSSFHHTTDGAWTQAPPNGARAGRRFMLSASVNGNCTTTTSRRSRLATGGVVYVILFPYLSGEKKVEKRLAEMGPKVATLENAQAATAKWQRVMEHLTQNTPPGIWLTNVRSTATDPKNPVQVSFTGLSGNQDSVGGYILRLQNCPELGDVNLKFTQEKATQFGPTVEFEISGVVLGTQEEEEKKDGDEAAKEGQKA